jgi:hypothetical protein
MIDKVKSTAPSTLLTANYDLIFFFNVQSFTNIHIFVKILY